MAACNSSGPPKAPESPTEDDIPLPPPSATAAQMPKRKLGKTGVEVSAIGLGGYHIGMPKDEAESIRIIRTAIDHGITFLDNCWDYNEGESEERMGKALRDGYRQKAFLMTKLDARPGPVADRAARAVAEAPPDRRDRSGADPRGHPHGGPGGVLSRGRRASRRCSRRRRRARSASSASPATRIPEIHLAMLEGRRRPRLRVRHRADAAQRDGRALPELREEGAAGARAEGDRRARDEVAGLGHHPQEQGGDAPSSACTTR